MLLKIESDFSSSPRFVKLLLLFEELSMNHGVRSADKLFRKILNDSAKNVATELRKGLLIGVAWKMNTLITKVIQRRGQDKPIDFGMPITVVDYLFLKIFSDEKISTSKKIEAAVVKYFETQNEQTPWKEHFFDASFQDIIDFMKKAIDSI